MNKNQNLIHIKLDYQEAVNSKRDVLSSQMAILRILQTIKKYHALRMEELNLKLKLYKKIKELKINIEQLQKTLPALKIPEILNHKEILLEDHHEEVEKKIQKVKESQKDNSIEAQLQEIQNRLNSLA